MKITRRKPTDPEFDTDTITVTLDNDAEFRVYTYASTYDGKPVVQIDTDEKVGRFAVSINDGVIWDADADLPIRVDGLDVDGLTIVNVEQPMPDDDALDEIAALMSGAEWSADTVDAVAAIVRRAGRTIEDVS